MLLTKVAPASRTTPASVAGQAPKAGEVRVRALRGFGRAQAGIAEQCRLALRQGAASLAAAGLCMEDVVRVTYLVRDADAFPSCFPLLRDAFGDARPGSTLRLVGGFERPDMQIEIELVARRCSKPVAARS